MKNKFFKIIIIFLLSIFILKSSIYASYTHKGIEYNYRTYKDEGATDWEDYVYYSLKKWVNITGNMIYKGDEVYFEAEAEKYDDGKNYKIELETSLCAAEEDENEGILYIRATDSDGKSVMSKDLDINATTSRSDYVTYYYDDFSCGNSNDPITVKISTAKTKVGNNFEGNHKIQIIINKPDINFEIKLGAKDSIGYSPDPLLLVKYKADRYIQLAKEKKERLEKQKELWDDRRDYYNPKPGGKYKPEITYNDLRETSSASDILRVIMYDRNSPIKGEYQGLEKFAEKEKNKKLLEKWYATLDNAKKNLGIERTEAYKQYTDQVDYVNEFYDNMQRYYENAQNAIKDVLEDQKVSDETKKEANDIDADTEKIIEAAKKKVDLIISSLFSSKKRQPVENLDVLNNIDYYKPPEEGENDASDLEEKIGLILKVITNFGIILSMLMSAVLGIKYMLGSVEERAEYKKDMIPYLVGVFLLFSICTIMKIIQGLANYINKI